MRPIGACQRSALFGVVAASALLATETVQAGGLAVREQSTSSQGASFAGSAAGYDLSSAFWNPAAFGIVGRGLSSETHAALIVPSGDVTGINDTGIGCAALSCSAEIGLLALVPASYYAYRLNKDWVLGLSINSPFGLATKPDPYFWQGAPVAQTSKVFTANVSPTLSYQIAPGLFIGAGAQFEYAKLTLRFADGLVPPTTASAEADDDVGVGFTAGILWQPTKSTSFGLGFRSTITHDLEGNLKGPVATGGASVPIDLKLETPEIATLSIRQAIAPNTRLLGTIEWTNWSRFDSIPIKGTGASLDGGWHDGWLYAVGLEYDVNHKLTVRTGLAFEKSPIQNADERLLSVPDSDRWWLSGGLTYRWSEKMTLDFAYTHIFFADAPIDRDNLSGTVNFTGSADQSADIVSVGFKYKWGARSPESLK